MKRTIQDWMTDEIDDIADAYGMSKKQAAFGVLENLELGEYHTLTEDETFLAIQFVRMIYRSA